MSGMKTISLSLIGVLAGLLLMTTPTLAQTAVIGDSIAKGIATHAPTGQTVIDGGIVGAGITQGDVAGNTAHWTNASRKAPLTLLEIGTNDFGYRHAEHYADLLDRIFLPIGVNTRLCVILPPIPEKLSIRQGVIERRNTIIAWAKERGLRAVTPQYNPKNRAPDGIHFTTEGYREIAKNAFNACSLRK